MRELNPIDTLLLHFDNAIRTVLTPQKRPCNRPTPADDIEETKLSSSEKRHVAGLMRVNHAGEVCAQALYQGQALTAKLDHVKAQMQKASLEEQDHLAWCEQRLTELQSKPSILNPFWYLASYSLGAFAGILGDKISLGFVAETERQVSAHLQKHQLKLPKQDLKTNAILAQMEKDETKHATEASRAGGAKLPSFVKYLMTRSAKFLTFASYYI